MSTAFPEISTLHLPVQNFHLVTGKLAASGLRDHLTELARRLGFKFTIDVLNISVAALLTPEWIAKRIDVPPSTTAVLIPGYCDRNVSALQQAVDVPVYVGPRDFRLIEEMLTGRDRRAIDLRDYSIEIIAEINHAPRLSLEEIKVLAQQFSTDGADVIDIGCEPGDPWPRVADAVRAVRDIGLRVSIDSLNPAEIAPAVDAGAELVLSVNATNRTAAADWGCEVVAIPDDFHTLGGLDETLELLEKSKVPFRIDPILEPIGCGFAKSLGRFVTVRERYPNAPMMMGIGNLTELTDVDSAGVNVLLLGFCEELNICSVLTTQVINWARTSIRECEIGRRLVHYAIQHGTVPKNIDSSLVMLRDVKVLEQSVDALARMHENLKDPNYRIFAQTDQLHLMNNAVHFRGTDPFELFEQLMQSKPSNVTPDHAFYLGFEMAKALTAITLGKQYDQDQPLDWGMLTQHEKSHRAAKRKKNGD